MMETPRYVCLWVPNWTLSSLVVEVPPGAAAAVVQKNRVEVFTPSAHRRGIRQAMPLVMAQYLVPDLITFPPDSDREGAAFEAVLEVFDQFAAGVVAVKPGLAFAPARGPAKWAGGETELAAELTEQVTVQTGAECLVGIADTVGGALRAVRDGQIIPSGKTEQFLDDQLLADLAEDLPPAERSLISEDLKILRTLGINTVRQLRDLGAGPIVTRFGSSGQILLNLLRGQAVFTRQNERAVSSVEAQVELDPPAFSVAHSVTAIRQVTTALADRLMARGLYASTVRVTLERVSGARFERTWTLLDATASLQVGKRVTWQVKGLADSLHSLSDHSESQALRYIHLVALHPVVVPEADTLWGGAQNLRKAANAVEEVQALLGEESAVVPIVHGGFDPRTRVSFFPWGTAPTGLPPLERPWQGAVSEPPIVLFSDPKPALLMGYLEDGTIGRVFVGERGRLNGHPKHLIIRDDHVELPSGDHPISGVERVWVIRGRWWRGAEEEHRPRCYLRIRREYGPDLLVVQRSRNWWVEGIYAEQSKAASKLGRITSGSEQV